MAAHELMLDPAIRNWVLLPLFLIMFLIGILRNNVTKMMRKDVTPEAEQVKHNNQLMRARRLRAARGCARCRRRWCTRRTCVSANSRISNFARSWRIRGYIDP